MGACADTDRFKRKAALLHSNLTLTLELFHNTDDRSAPTDITYGCKY
jgi:hypothetical protein